MSTNKKIKRVLNKIVGRIDIRNKEDRDWYNDVKDKASTFKTNEEKLEYLQGILDKLKKNDGETASEATKSNTWPAIALGVALFILVVGGAALYFSFLAPKSASASNNTVATSSVANSNMDLPKEDFQVIDYKVM